MQVEQLRVGLMRGREQVRERVGGEERWMDGGRDRGNMDDEEVEERDTEVLGAVMYVGLSESGRGRCSVLLTLGKQRPPCTHAHAHAHTLTHTYTKTLVLVFS